MSCSSDVHVQGYFQGSRLYLKPCLLPPLNLLEVLLPSHPLPLSEMSVGPTAGVHSFTQQLLVGAETWKVKSIPVPVHRGVRSHQEGDGTSQWIKCAWARDGCKGRGAGVLRGAQPSPGGQRSSEEGVTGHSQSWRGSVIEAADKGGQDPPPSVPSS